MKKDNTMDSQCLEVVKKLKSRIKINIEEKWWLKKEFQPKDYQNIEIEPAMDRILQVFDRQWVEDVFNEWLRDPTKNHLMIQYLVEKGSIPLSMLVGLGNDLIEVGTLKKSERLIKDIKNGTKFISAAFETEIAAECVRRGFDVELYPDLCGKIPDLKIIFDSKPVYLEMAEIHPSQRIHSLYETLNSLFDYVRPLIPENTKLRLTTNKLISKDQSIKIRDRLQHIIKDNLSPSASFQIDDLIVGLEIEKDEWGKSFYIKIPSEFVDRELKRLKDKIKNEARQISEPNLGVIVVDATNTLSSAFSAIGRSIKESQSLGQNLTVDIILDILEPMDKNMGSEKEVEAINKIKDNIKKIFEQDNYSNLLGVVVIRSFKFFKGQNEVIIVENPHCTESQLLKKIEELYAFSRAINL